MSSSTGDITITVSTELCVSFAIFTSTAAVWRYYVSSRRSNRGSSTNNGNNKTSTKNTDTRIDSEDRRELQQQQQQQQLLLEDPYVQRRLSDRLSYHNLSEEDATSSDDELYPSQTNCDHFEREAEEYDTQYDRLPSTTTASAKRPSSRQDSPPQPLSTPPHNPAATPRHRRNAARQRYNTRIMPQTVLLIRHGQSMGNVNEALYETTPDNAMPLTPLGWEQARAAGRHLKNTVFQHTTTTNGSARQRIHFIVSPYVRTLETLHGILSAWVDPDSIVLPPPNKDDDDDDTTSNHDNTSDDDRRLHTWYTALQALGLSWHEDPRIREQDFGNYQDPDHMRRAKADRHRFGAFYYRFPHGESASDVFDRVSTFLDSLWRSFDVHTCPQYVLVTHGIAIRILLARYYRYSIDQFHRLANPRNCECVELQHDGRGKLVLAGRYELEHNDDGDGDPVGYQHHRRLRIVRDPRVRSVRMSYTAPHTTTTP